MAKYLIKYNYIISVEVDAIGPSDAVLKAKHLYDLGKAKAELKSISGKQLITKETFNHSFPSETKKRNRKAK